MKFRVAREVLAEAVAWTARSLPPRPSVPVLAGILLEVDGSLQVVGESSTAAMAMTYLRRRMPDVAIIGDELPDARGLDLAWHIRQQTPRVTVVLQLTAHEIDEISRIVCQRIAD